MPSHAGWGSGCFSAYARKVDLVYVERMQFRGCVDNPPMLIRTDASARHRAGISCKLPSIDVETVLVFREKDSKIRCSLFQTLNVGRTVNGRALIHSLGLLGRSI